MLSNVVSVSALLYGVPIIADIGSWSQGSARSISLITLHHVPIARKVSAIHLCNGGHAPRLVVPGSCLYAKLVWHICHQQHLFATIAGKTEASCVVCALF